jgi:repressor of nif and glnA expression
MATSITKYMRQLSTIKTGEITDRDKNIMRAVMQRFEISNEEFKRIWSSLIRNNYITPWKKKTASGYVQTNAYVINRQYLRRCLTAFEV